MFNAQEYANVVRLKCGISDNVIIITARLMFKVQLSSLITNKFLRNEMNALYRNLSIKIDC